MKSDIKTNAERTNYPELYAATYWGGQRCDDLPERIFEGRDAIVERYHIISYNGRLRDDVARYFRNPAIFDHIEVYTCEWNYYLIIVSPYGRCFNHTFHATGFYPERQLYAPSAESWAFEIQGVRQFKRHLRIVGELIELRLKIKERREEWPIH